MSTPPTPPTIEEMIAALAPAIKQAETMARHMRQRHNHRGHAHSNGWTKRLAAFHAILDTLKRLQDDGK